MKKTHFVIEHILAILAHECTHNYLHYHRVNVSDELENEVLTDLTVAYLGLGSLYLDGFDAGTAEIGYVAAKDIRYAIVYSAKLRKLKKLASFLPLLDRMNVSFYLCCQKLLRFCYSASVGTALYGRNEPFERGNDDT